MNLEFNGNHLLRSIKAGGNRIIVARDELNKINVFPVADRDTGNNLASLMRSISEIPEDGYYSIKEVLQSVANKALEGAKGNSGMIFAQYFNGIARFYKSSENDIQAFTYALVFAVKEAYAAIQQPQEGTILTVMNTWATGLQEEISKTSLHEALVRARTHAYHALLETKYQHKFMKQHQVVDAGAKGFYEFVDGLTDALIGEEVDSHRLLTQHGHGNHDIHETMSEKPDHQYCMEVTYRCDHDGYHMKKVLEHLGNSMVVVQGDQQSRIHIHTNQPEAVIQAIQSHAYPLKIKIDNMTQQYYDLHENQEKIALVTDSIADLPQTLMDNYNVHVLPLTILVDETEHLDKLTLDNNELLSMVAEGKKDISTSLASQTQILRLFEQLEQGYTQVLVISVSSALSGTYQAFNNAMKDYHGNLEIAVIDSKLNSIAQGLLVKQAGEYIKQGMLFDQLVNTIEKDKTSIEIFVLVEDLNPMIKSGRVPQTVGKMLQKFKFKPMVSLDAQGFGKLVGVGRSTKHHQKKIKQRIQKQKHQVTDILLGYTSRREDTDLWCDFFEKNGFKSIESVQTSAIIALSAGQSARAVAIKYERGENV